MIRHKAMFKVFFMITALCLGTPSEAGIPCIWCDNELLQSFIDCCTQRMANNPNFKTCVSSMEEMKTSLLKAARAMKNSGPTKESVMKGAMAYEMASCLSDTDGNPNKKILFTKNMLNRCYQTLDIKPDEVYIKEVSEIMKDKLEEKGDPSNVQQPKKETQSYETPQSGQDTSPSQYNSSPPQQVAAYPNQGNNQWKGPYDKKQQQRPNFEPNPSQGSANAFAFSSANAYSIPSGTPQQPPALPYNANPNQPYYPYNQKYNNQGNPSAYPFAYQNNPLNTANSNTGVSAASLSYASNEPQSQKGYNTPYASSFASAASQTPYNYPPQNYDYNPNSPAFNAAAASSASSSATNYDGNNAASSSSGSYSFANSNQKPFPFNNTNKKGKQKLLIPTNRPQSENIWPPPQNQQNKWDNNPNLNPVIPNTPITQPELVKTSSVPQQTSPTATQNVDQENNWKNNNQKNVPNTKDDKNARALRFSKTLYEVFIHDESFKIVFHEYMTKDQSKTVVPYMLYDGLSTCGYDEKTTQEFATKSISFMDGFPFPSATSSYAEAICQMLMVQFYRSDLIGDDPYSQASDLGDAMSKALKKLVSPPPIQDNVTKPVFLSPSEQNLPDYPKKRVPYDDSNSNYYADNPAVKPDSFSNKQLNQPLDLQNKGSDYPLSQTLPIQKQKNQPNVYDANDQPTDDKSISYDKNRNIKNKKKADQSYADSDDKIVYSSDDNDHDVSPGQWQKQKQKNQPNTNDNNDQSPDDESISYDKTIKNKSDKKDDQSYIIDKTVYRNYNDKKQTSNDKQIKKGNQPYFGSTDKDHDNSDDYYPYGYFDDNGTYVYFDDYYDPGKNDEDDDINPNYFLAYPEKEQSPRNDYNNNDKSKYKPKQQPDILIQKDDSKTNKQGYNNPDTYNAPDDDSKKILISKTLEQQKDKSNPLYLPDYDKYGGQKPSKQPLPLPPITDDQKNSKLPEIGQENFSTAPIKPETWKNSDKALNPDKQTDLSTDAPVFQPDISDNSTNPDLSKAKNDESKARVEILKKWAVDCIKGEKFNYETYAGVIAKVEKMVQQKHPDWPQQKCQTEVLIETVFALSQLLLKSNVKEAKYINQQPQKIVEPVELPPNSQWNNQNVPQKNQNPNYQSGQTNKNSQPEIQDKPAVGYSAPEQNIAYTSQNQEIQQNKWDSNPNPYPVQNTFMPQPKPINENYVPQPNIPNSNQPSAQNYNSNVGNQEWRNNGRQISNDNANSRQYRQPPPIPGQVNTNQENGKWNDKIFSIPQTVNSNVGAPNIINFKQPSDNQANLPGLQQKEGNNPSFFQNGNQGSFRYAQSRAVASSGQSENQVVTGIRDNWAPTPNYLNNPSSVKENQASAEPQANWSPTPNGLSLVNVNQPFSEAQANWSPTPNGPNNPSLLQNGKWGSIEEQGNWAPNGPSNPSFLQKGQNINQASFAESQDNWSPISNVQSNPNFPQNGNQGNWAASQMNDFVNHGNPNIGGLNQPVNSQQRNTWNRAW